MGNALQQGLMTAEDLSTYLAIPLKTVYRWSYRGEGPRSLKVGRHLRYRAQDVDEWLQSREQTA